MSIESLEQEALLSNYEDVATLDNAGHVRLVRDQSDGRLKVLKRLALFDQNVYEFLQANPGPHRSIVLGHILYKGELYVVEEYVSGRTLRAVLREEGPLAEEQAVRYLEQICAALRPLHALSSPIVNRDLKPENIMITHNNDAVVVDFNSAKFSNRTRSKDTTLLGTPGYAAPEQFGFRPSGPTSDIYALGVLLHEMLTGKMPDEARYDGRLKLVLLRCLALDPAMRYESVDALLDDIRHAGEDDQPHRPRSTRRLSMRPIPTKGFRSWLPPGVRGRNPLVILSSLLGYILLFLLMIAMLAGETDPALLAISIILFAGIIVMIFWAGDYRGIPRRLVGHTRLGSRPLLRAISGILGIGLIFFLLLLILVAVFS